MHLSDGSVAYYEAGWENTITADNVKEFIGPSGRIKIVEQDHRMECQEEGALIEYFDYNKNEYKMINVNCKRRPTGDPLNHLIRMIEGNVESVPLIDDVYKSFCTVIEADEILRKKI